MTQVTLNIGERSFLVLQHVSGKRVAQHVRRDGNLDPGSLSIFFNDEPRPLARELLTAMVQEQGSRVVAGLDQRCSTLRDIIAQSTNRPLSNRDKAFLASSASLDPDNASRQVDIVQLECDQLRHTHASRIEQLDECSVSLGFGPLFSQWSRQKSLDVVAAQGA